MTFLIKFIGLFLVLYSIYQLGSLAGLFSERSGVANIAIEGNMVLSAAMFSIIWNLIEGSIGMINVELALSMIAAVIICSIYMMILSHLTNRYMANHIIVGTGMNLLAPALGLFAYHFLVTSHNDSIIASYENWITLLDIGGSNYVFQTLNIWFFAITIAIVIISAFVLNKTRYGLRLKSSGENPYSLETAGVSVAKTRMSALLIAGMLSAMAGVMFATKGTFNFTVNGSGFLAIGILILGQYKVSGTIIGSFIFALLISFFECLPFLIVIDGDYINLLKAIPFIIPLIGLMLFRKHSAPAAVGTNFKKDQR